MLESIGAPPAKDSPTPWKQLLSQKSVWAVVVSDAFMGGFAGGIFFAFVPTYMFHQLGFSLQNAGFMVRKTRCSSHSMLPKTTILPRQARDKQNEKVENKGGFVQASVPYIAKLFAQLFIPQTADNLIQQGWDVTKVRKYYQGFPSIVGALCSLVLCLGSPGAGLSVLLMTITTAMDGKETVVIPAINVENDHFTKTCSGQTQGKLMARPLNFCRAEGSGRCDVPD